MSARNQARVVTSVLLTGWGALLLSRPEEAAALVSGPSAPPPATVVRALGGRRVAQHLLTLLAPSRTVLLGSAATDALHAASMVAAAFVWPQYRRPALTSAAIATAAAVVCGRAASSGA